MLKPLNNRLLLEPIPVNNLTADGIELAVHSEQSRLIRQVYPDRAKVVYNDILPEVKQGDIVVYKRLASQTIECTPYVVCDCQGILAVEEVA